MALSRCCVATCVWWWPRRSWPPRLPLPRPVQDCVSSAFLKARVDPARHERAVQVLSGCAP